MCRPDPGTHEDLKLKALEILGETIIDKAVDLPSRSVYTFSPYSLVAKISDEGISRLPEVMHEYIQAYMKLWQDAKSIAEKPEGDFYLRKKEATRTLMKGNDPGTHERRDYGRRHNKYQTLKKVCRH